jgi:glycogen phosphorylase
VLEGGGAETHRADNGWALSGEVDSDPRAQDQRDAERLHQLLDDEVVPAFYDRDEHGRPVGWLQLIRASLQSIGPTFSAGRMLSEYVAGPYGAR